MTSNKPASLLFLLAAFASLVVATWWYVDGGPLQNEAPANEKKISIQKQSSSLPQESTIASKWDWQAVAETKQEKHAQTEATAPFDVSIIYENLQDVRLNEDGDVVLDDRALKALNETLAYSGLQLSEADLLQLQELIRIGLPGKAGEQTAKIVGDYYNFLGAKREFDAVYEGIASPENQQAQFDELLALREIYLGPEVAGKLFAKEDDDARFMIESMRIDADTSLGEAEKEARQQQLAQRYHQNTPPIADWASRREAFMRQQELIRQAGLEKSEEEAQIKNLKSSHFNADELALMDEYGISLAGDN